MQTAIVIVIVAAAAFFLIRRFYKSVHKGNSSTCGCGCDGCTPIQKQNCSETEERKA